MFERPTKNDLDRSLSELMHENRHKLMTDVNRIKSDASKIGSLQGNRLIVTAMTAADEIHKEAMTKANPILLDFIERMGRPPAEIVGWARPHLENLGNSLLGGVPPNNFPQDHQRLTLQYRTVFQQRLDSMLRNVEIGFVKGAGFARAGKMESVEEWINAAEAERLLKPAFGTYEARLTICKRAHGGMLRARAQRFITDSRSVDNFEIPSVFWWAEGKPALTQNWTAGDFDTWVETSRIAGNHHFNGLKVHMQAFKVSFLRANIEILIPPVPPEAPAVVFSPAVGGRPPSEWWEDLLIEICFQHFRGDLKPKVQADIERAMQEWITKKGFEAAPSTVRIRARKVWQAIKSEAEN